MYDDTAVVVVLSQTLGFVPDICVCVWLRGPLFAWVAKTLGNRCSLELFNIVDIIFWTSVKVENGNAATNVPTEYIQYTICGDLQAHISLVIYIKYTFSSSVWQCLYNLEQAGVYVCVQLEECADIVCVTAGSRAWNLNLDELKSILPWTVLP